jgi:hypothetical protein
MAVATKKITVATVKSFIKKNRAELLINVRSAFDGMQDMTCDTGDSGFTAAKSRVYYCRETGKDVPVSHDNPNTMGVSGVWFTHGRNSCSVFENETHNGYTVYNCCGEWTVAVAK